MSYQANYTLVRAPETRTESFEFKPDRMAVINTLNRIAQVAQERIMLMMNNTEMCKVRRMRNMADVLTFLNGQHDDQGMSGDRGDFYRRKLADQLHVTFAVEGVTHNNVVSVVEAAIILERETRRVLASSAQGRDIAPTVNIDDTILNILARIADLF